MTSAAALRRYLSNAALSVPPSYIFRDNFYSLYVVDGSSMMPSLRVGDVVLVRKSDVYPHASWRRWTSSDASPPSPLLHGAPQGEQSRRRRRLRAKTTTNGRSAEGPIGDRWTGRTYMRPPTVHVVGSVIVYRAPGRVEVSDGEYRIKRVVGLGGTALPCLRRGRDVMVRVPPFALWVEGEQPPRGGGMRGGGGGRDSRDDGVDQRSTTTATATVNGVIGIAERIVWPPSRWGRYPGVDPPMPPRSWWI
ncbi:hypothetical protein ACHAW5_005697 [Stephanodiscus triporus]|uniref:Peptidase S26 domain-containing protein n=1 Tax=Stephanodiscus triporus TaxID=2934178 RepID=A0ABD3NLB7_9STRA